MTTRRRTQSATTQENRHHSGAYEVKHKAAKRRTWASTRSLSSFAAFTSASTSANRVTRKPRTRTAAARRCFVSSLSAWTAMSCCLFCGSDTHTRGGGGHKHKGHKQQSLASAQTQRCTQPTFRQRTAAANPRACAAHTHCNVRFLKQPERPSFAEAFLSYSCLNGPWTGTSDCHDGLRCPAQPLFLSPRCCCCQTGGQEFARRGAQADAAICCCSCCRCCRRAYRHQHGLDQHGLDQHGLGCRLVPLTLTLPRHVGPHPRQHPQHHHHQGERHH